MEKTVIDTDAIAHAVVDVIDDQFIRVSWSRVAALAGVIYAGGVLTGVKLSRRYRNWKLKNGYQV